MRILSSLGHRFRLFQGGFRTMPNGLYCFNYHRIGDAHESALDPNVYSCDEQQFAQHLKFYKHNFRIVEISELLELIAENKAVEEPIALITFDDGYRDNYELAYPLLLQHEITAAFFVATDYIDLAQLPWWDEIAWLVRNTSQSILSLPGWHSSIDLKQHSCEQSIRLVLRQVKANKSLQLQEQLEQLRNRLSSCPPPRNLYDKLFMSWDELREMQSQCMHIGSHSASHEILAYLDARHQHRELEKSFSRIQEELSPPIASLAYPVGNAEAFSKVTENKAQEIGYQLAFSFISGLNRKLNQSLKYQIRRIPVTNNCDVKQLRRSSFAAAHIK